LEYASQHLNYTAQRNRFQFVLFQKSAPLCLLPRIRRQIIGQANRQAGQWRRLTTNEGCFNSAIFFSAFDLGGAILSLPY
jgi:hypothetical protein